MEGGGHPPPPIVCSGRNDHRSLMLTLVTVRPPPGTPNLWIRTAVLNCYCFKRFTDSQLFPPGFKYVCPKAYEEVEQDGKRGNFLAVIGRSQLDQLLLSSVKKNYENGKSWFLENIFREVQFCKHLVKLYLSEWHILYYWTTLKTFRRFKYIKNIF